MKLPVFNSSVEEVAIIRSFFFFFMKSCAVHCQFSGGFETFFLLSALTLLNKYAGLTCAYNAVWLILRSIS